MKKILFTIIFLSFAFSAEAATMVAEYNFDNWAGTCESTVGYPFYVCGAETGHPNGTEVVTSCGDWLPQAGSHFFYEQGYAGLSSDPCLALGDDPETINTHNRIDIPDLENEIFIHFYFRFAGEANTLADHRSMKFVALETNGRYGSTDDMEIWSHFDDDGKMYFMDERTGDWRDVEYWPNGVNPLLDNGVWYSYAVYANLQEGVFKVWMDTTDWENPTIDRVGYTWYNLSDLVPATTFSHIYLHENYSAKSPVASLQFALDSLEIWDGIPNSVSDDISPANPSGLSVS